MHLSMAQDILPLVAEGKREGRRGGMRGQIMDCRLYTLVCPDTLVCSVSFSSLCVPKQTYKVGLWQSPTVKFGFNTSS